MSDVTSDLKPAANSSDLPPPREKQALRSVSPPLSNLSIRRFNYYIAIFAIAVFAFYSWRILQWKSAAGGWWNLALGKNPEALHNMQEAHANWNGKGGGGGGVGVSGDSPSKQGHGDLTVEDRINELAAALGVPSKDLASAIAGAVKEYIPPASLSSLAASQTGEALNYLVDPTGASSADAENNLAATAARGVKVVATALEAAMGFDEPPDDIV